MKKLIGVLLVGLLVLTAFAACKKAESVAAPVDFAGGTRLIWNGEDITGEVAGSIDVSKTEHFRYAGVVADGGSSPCSNFEIALLDTPELKVDTSTQIAVFWTSSGPHHATDLNGGTIALDGQHYTYAQDGRTVAEISFSGIDKQCLKAVTAGGLILQFPEAGTPAFSYTVTDSAGEVSPEVGHEFTIEPA